MHHKHSPKLPLLFFKMHLALSYYPILIQIFWTGCFLRILQFNFTFLFSGLRCSHITQPTWNPCFHFPKTLKAVQIIQLSTGSCHLLCLWFKHSPVPSVLTQPQSMNSFTTVFLDTHNPCPSTDVRQYKQAIKLKYFYSHPYLPEHETKKIKKNFEIKGKKKIHLTKIQISYYTPAGWENKLLIIMEPTHIIHQQNKTYRNMLQHIWKSSVMSPTH